VSELKVRSLSIDFGGVRALNDVSLDVPKGAFVGLMGPNGAGKTTVINCISRIYKPVAGQIEFGGENVLSLSSDQVKQIGISRTFQDLNFYNLMPSMSVLDYVMLGQFDPKKNRFLPNGLQLRSAKNYERDLKRNARKILDFFRQAREFLEPPQAERNYPILMGRGGAPDLLDVERSPIQILSFAWRRRLDLARALISNPKLLLLDEPAQGLPPFEIDNLGKILKLIQKEFGVSALIVEHNVDTLMKISDHIVVMSSGEVIAKGLPDEVSKNQQVVDIYLGSGSTSKPGNESRKSNVRSRDVQPVLELKNIDMFYGSAQALFSVSLKIFPNEISSVLGTNGSGKSSLLKAISGLEKPAFGEIVLDGEPLPLGWPEAAVARGLQYVPQGRMIFPELTVLENLRIGVLSTKVSLKEGLEKVFHYFPTLKTHLKSQAASLSGGLQQMLAIGQAIMGSPEVLLLDEPSLGLAPQLIESLFEVIQNIKNDEKCAIVLVEQNAKKAIEMSDYIFIFNSGMLIAEGTGAQLRGDDETLKKYLGFH